MINNPPKKKRTPKKLGGLYFGVVFIMLARGLAYFSVAGFS